jgi:hypothetical protein
MTYLTQIPRHVWDVAPMGSEITIYDEQHFLTYMRLLDAQTDGADWKEVAQIVLHSDPVLTSPKHGAAGKSSWARNG